MVFAKRGTRAGIVDEHGDPTTELHLAHSSGGMIYWKRINQPQDAEKAADLFTAFANTITTPMTASAIVKRAAEELKRGERTMWRAWKGGEGDLGQHFTRDGNLYIRKSTPTSTPYNDD